MKQERVAPTGSHIASETHTYGQVGGKNVSIYTDSSNHLVSAKVWGNGADNHQGTGENKDAQASASDKGAPAFRPNASDVFTHHTVEDPNTEKTTPFPEQTKDALDKFLSTTVGKIVAVFTMALKTRIDLEQIPTDSKYYKPDFSQDGPNTIIYSLDVKGFLSQPGNQPYAYEYRGVGLDVLLAHEIGHTQVASEALGYPYSPGFSWQNEFDVVTHAENPYRSSIGAPLRYTYTGQVVPGQVNIPPGGGP